MGMTSDSVVHTLFREFNRYWKEVSTHLLTQVYLGITDIDGNYF
jgi:hypothetical protein